MQINGCLPKSHQLMVPSCATAIKVCNASIAMKPVELAAVRMKRRPARRDHLNLVSLRAQDMCDFGEVQHDQLLPEAAPHIHRHA